MNKLLISAAALILGLGIFSATAQTPDATTALPPLPAVGDMPETMTVAMGAFTAAQVMRGQAVYNQLCTACHGRDLRATNDEASDLRGAPFTRTWVDRTIAERFTKIQTTMPATRPGILTDQQTLDIIAFILNFNGYRQGMTELTYSPNLSNLKIPAPPRP